MTEVLYPTLDENQPVHEIMINGKKLILKPLCVLSNIDVTWHEKLRQYRLTQRIMTLYRRAYKEGFEIYPLAKDVFNVFSMPVTKIRCVVVGQDPYPGFDKNTKTPVANGYAFGTESMDTPGSLQRIKTSIGSCRITDSSRPNSLQGWIDQGVFLLNITPFLMHGEVLTDGQQKMVASAKMCWAGITEDICQFISGENPNCNFILLGKEAHLISKIVKKSHKEGHPSMRTDSDFEGLCFRKVPEINWAVM